MGTEERDHTADWIVPPERIPPSAFDLQRRIEVAMAVAKAAEEAALDIGQASLEAAEQARQAAAHAERSAEAALAAARSVAGGKAAPAPVSGSDPLAAASEPVVEPPVVIAVEDPVEEPRLGHESIPGSELPAGWSPVSNGSKPVVPVPPRSQPDAFDERMIAFRDRAERVLVRLRRLDAAPPVS